MLHSLLSPFSLVWSATRAQFLGHQALGTMWSGNIPGVPSQALQGLLGQEIRRHWTSRAEGKEAGAGGPWMLCGWQQAPCPSLTHEAAVVLASGASTVQACLSRSSVAAARQH